MADFLLILGIKAGLVLSAWLTAIGEKPQRRFISPATRRRLREP